MQHPLAIRDVPEECKKLISALDQYMEKNNIDRFTAFIACMSIAVRNAYACQVTLGDMIDGVRRYWAMCASGGTKLR
jgi:hypothetical protein